MNALEHAILLQRELDTYRPLKAEVEARMLQRFRLDWNFHSNHLEGNTLTYSETKALLLFGITAGGKPLKDHYEIVGHNEAILLTMEVLAQKRPLSEQFIRELNALVLKEPYVKEAITPDGKPTQKRISIGMYKTLPNHVKTVTGEIFYFATPEETPSMMTELIDWYRVEIAKENANAIVIAATFHYRFIRIHPFDDGNGRVARLLMNFILIQMGFPPVIIKSQDKSNYIAALRQADAGMLVTFVDYIAENLTHSLQLMLKAAKGEPIPDDEMLDKELFLLEQRLKAVSKPKLTPTE